MQATMSLRADVARAALFYVINGQSVDDAVALAAQDVGLYGEIAVEQVRGIIIKYPLVVELV